ncbi:MAG: hypothetical protein WD024_01340 [Bacillota bacterium]
MSWAWTLLKAGNKVGAVWSVLLAVTSTATGLYYFYHHGFFP